MKVVDPAYWRERVLACGGDLQRAMYDGSADKFAEAHQRHMQEVQAADIGDEESILDVGCGYGRLLQLLRPTWRGRYVGCDICKEFLALAQILHPEREFMCTAPSGTLHFEPKAFDVAVAVWVKSMLMRNGYPGVWQKLEAEMHRVARKVVVVW